MRAVGAPVHTTGEANSDRHRQRPRRGGAHPYRCDWDALRSRLGKPKDYDPATDKEEIRPRFDPSRYTPEQLTEIERVLRMVAATQAGMRPLRLPFPKPLVYILAEQGRQ